MEEIMMLEYFGFTTKIYIPRLALQAFGAEIVNEDRESILRLTSLYNAAASDT
jgi:hypothetical protein